MAALGRRFHPDRRAGGEVVDVRAEDEDIVGSDQLCRVTGRFERSGAEHAVECLGLRSSRSGGFDLGKLSLCAPCRPGSKSPTRALP